MADDTVTRLQELMADLLYNPDCDDEGCGDCAWHRIGADAIAEIERLRTLGDMMTHALHYAYSPLPEDVADLLAAWEEARRG